MYHVCLPSNYVGIICVLRGINRSWTKKLLMNQLSVDTISCVGVLGWTRKDFDSNLRGKVPGVVKQVEAYTCLEMDWFKRSFGTFEGKKFSDTFLKKLFSIKSGSVSMNLNSFWTHTTAGQRRYLSMVPWTLGKRNASETREEEMFELHRSQSLTESGRLVMVLVAFGRYFWDFWDIFHSACLDWALHYYGARRIS